MPQWVKIRQRAEYLNMRKAISSALDVYWDAVGCEKPIWTKYIYACELVTLSSYRLLRYIRREYGGINECIDDRKIGETCDAATAFYCMGDVEKTSFQEESDILEILSRAAYREMKAVKRARDDEGAEAWR